MVAGNEDYSLTRQERRKIQRACMLRDQGMSAFFSDALNRRKADKQQEGEVVMFRRRTDKREAE